MTRAMSFARARLPGVSLLSAAASEYQHKRLVKYYSFFGFTPVKRVGDSGLADLPDQVAWGGVGTRMDVEVTFMLRKWSSTVLRKLAAVRNGGQGGGKSKSD